MDRSIAICTRTLSISALLAAGWAVPALAGPLELKDVPAGAAWVAHADVDAARSSQVVQKFFDACTQCMPGMKEKIEKPFRRLGMEGSEDLRGITAYGMGFEPHRGVLIIRGNMDEDAAVEAARKAPGHRTIEHRGHEIHAWTMRHGKRPGQEVAGTFFEPDVLVLASGPDILASALDVMDGREANVSGKDVPLGARVPEGAIFLVRADGIDRAAPEHGHPILAHIRRIDYAEGQREGSWFGNLTVTADSEKAARELSRVFQGLLALVSLEFADQPAIAGTLEDIETTVDGEMVKVTFEESADELASRAPEICDALIQRFKGHHRKEDRSGSPANGGKRF